jgi:hypothetical protein
MSPTIEPVFVSSTILEVHKPGGSVALLSASVVSSHIHPFPVGLGSDVKNGGELEPCECIST